MVPRDCQEASYQNIRRTMTIDNLFVENKQTLLQNIDTDVNTGPEFDLENWDEYYHKKYGFRSYYVFRIELYDNDYNACKEENIDIYLTDTIAEKISNYINIHCLIHSRVKRQIYWWKDGISYIDYDFFADFSNDARSFLRFISFMWRLYQYISKRYESILCTVDNRIPLEFGYVTLNDTSDRSMSNFSHFWKYAHIIDTLVYKKDTKNIKSVWANENFTLQLSTMTAALLFCKQITCYMMQSMQDTDEYTQSIPNSVIYHMRRYINKDNISYRYRS